MTLEDFLRGAVPSTDVTAIWLRDQLCAEHISIKGLLCSDEIEDYESWIEANNQREAPELVETNVLRIRTLGEMFGYVTEQTSVELGARGIDASDLTTTSAIRQVFQSGPFERFGILDSDDTIDANSTEAEIEGFIEAHGNRYPWEWLPSPRSL